MGGASYDKPPAIEHLFSTTKGDRNMSDEKKPFCRPKIPDGHAFRVTTRQKEIVPGQFFVGYETTWEPAQKEVPYTTPKTP
jgi:hypothetical protein